MAIRTELNLRLPNRPGAPESSQMAVLVLGVDDAAGAAMSAGF